MDGPTSLNEKPIRQVTVDIKQADRIRDLISNDETHSRCKDIQLSSLFLFGLNGKPSLDTNVITNELSDFINSDLNSLAIDGYIDSRVQGFTIYNFLETKIDTPSGPRTLIKPNNVPTINLEITKILNKDYSCETVIKQTSHFSSVQDNNMLYYYEWNDYKPCIRTGKIRSSLAPFLSINESFLLKRKCHDSAIMQSSHPPVLYQDGPNKQDITDTSVKLAYAESYLGDMASEQEKKDAYEHQIEAHENKWLNHVWIPKNSILNQQVPLSENNDLKFYPTCIDNLHTVPRGFVVAPAIASAVPQPDFLEFEAAKDRKIALAWGIPPSIALADGSKSAASASSIGDNDLEFFAKQTQYMTKHIIDFITDVYKNLFSIPRYQKSDVIFELPIIPWISARALYELYNQNIINFDTLQLHTLRINGLSENDRALVPNVFVRPPPNGSENTVTGMIEARINNINAESAEKKQNALLTKEERVNGLPGDGEDPELAEMELQMKDKELEMAKLKLKHMDKQIALQEKKNQAPAPKPAAKA